MQVLVHSPYDFPEVGGRGFTISGGKVAYIGVDARHTSRYFFPQKSYLLFTVLLFSTDTVKSMAIKRRNCIKHDEDRSSMAEAGVTMEVFEDYSRPSCIIECRARQIYDTCHCLPYYFPNFALVWGISTECDSEGLECIANEAGILSALDTGEDNYEFFSEGAQCYCPVDCEENLYIPEMSQADIRESARAVQVN